MNPNQDTDPSTPGAKRQSEPRTPGARVAGATEVGSASSRNTTDPGLAPPGPMLPVPERPMGIVVPQPPASSGLNDSVDVLLEGISRELPDRPRDTSHSDGNPAATYHAEHAVPAPDRPPARNEPKVVIERASGKHTTRVARYAGPVEDSDPREWTETTAIRRQSLASRVVVAVGAGVIVVVAIFVALQRTSGAHIPFVTGPAPAIPALAAPSPSPPTTMPVVQVAAPSPLPAAPVAAEARPAPVAPAPAESAAAVPSIAAESLPAASSGAPASSARPAASSARASKPKAKAAASASKAPSADLGEFKTAL